MKCCSCIKIAHIPTFEASHTISKYFENIGNVRIRAC